MSYPSYGLTFARLREANLERNREVFEPCEDWSPNDWAVAVAGEVGEASNKLKKLRRGEDVPLAAIAEELADAVCYLDLLAARLGIDLGESVVEKFNAVSTRRGSTVFL